MKHKTLIVLLIAIVLVGLGVILFVTLRPHDASANRHVAAIVTNGLECSDIGK